MKKFDCVNMKWEIQQRISEDFRDMPAAEARDKGRRQIGKDPVLGLFLKKVRARSLRKPKADR